jgi:hypothetical protein
VQDCGDRSGRWRHFAVRCDRICDAKLAFPPPARETKSFEPQGLCGWRTIGEQDMNGQAGIWIDHRSAIVVLLGEGSEETRRIASGMEKHVRFSGHASSEEGSADDQRDRQFAAHLDRYYDEVIAEVGGERSLLLFGPGEAKGELAKRLSSKGLQDCIVGVETADKMTDRQIAAKVREHFRK